MQNIFVKWTVDFGYKSSTVAFVVGSSENGSIFTFIEPFTFQFISYTLYTGKSTANFTVIPGTNATTVTCVDAQALSSDIGTGCSIFVKGTAYKAFTHQKDT